MAHFRATTALLDGPVISSVHEIDDCDTVEDAALLQATLQQEALSDGITWAWEADDTMPGTAFVFPITSVLYTQIDLVEG